MSPAAKSVQRLRKALALDPAIAAMHNELGILAKSGGNLQAGLRYYRRACSADPEDAAALNNLANAIGASGDRRAAVPILERLVQQLPDFIEARQNYGDALRFLRRFDPARRTLRQALALNPQFSLPHRSLGAVEIAAGEVRSAIASYRRGLMLDSAAATYSDLLMALSYDETVTSEALFREYRQWSASLPRLPPPAPRTKTGRLDPEKRLRVGYVSADFREHSVARNLIGLMTAHDRSRVTIVCYAETRQEDDFTRRFRSHCDIWRPTEHLSDAEMQSQIRKDAIDILVFVAGHTSGNRIRVAAGSPAPIQAAIYDLSTTGLAEIGTWFTDPVLSPNDTRERFVETLHRLPCLYLHEPPTPAPPVASPPSRRKGYITFASFNNPAKHSPSVYRVWARILAAVPRSRLRLKYVDVYSTLSLRASIAADFAGLGIEPNRIEFVGESPSRYRHLEDFAGVDIALDPFPFNGCNTTFEALWMGVPVVTLAGERFLGRLGASHLHQLGLQELIAADPGRYVEIASALANDEPRRLALRETLRDRVKKSLLCNPPAFASSIERAYRELWRAWCARQQLG